MARWLRTSVKYAAVEVLGWVLVIAGIAALVLPGPGLLGLFAGIAILSQHYTWADRLVDSIEVRAKAAARDGVKTWPRTVISCLIAVWVFGCGIVWWISPEIPEFEVLGVGFGPALPLAGTITGLSMIVSAVIAWLLIGYSIKKYR